MDDKKTSEIWESIDATIQRKIRIITMDRIDYTLWNDAWIALVHPLWNRVWTNIGNPIKSHIMRNELNNNE